ncbi:phytoene desaturase [Candidatus Kaiserbacteria bacterium]|nr:phytoene desaturase [Candidatus Kaiserbacteria bacterium]
MGAENNKKKIVIVGAGPGGLAAGMLLAHKGFEVEIFEKNPLPGGRNGYIRLGEYKFDVGPTFFMMDFVLRDIFKATGRKLEDYVLLTRLSPMYRLYFDDREMNVYEEDDKMLAELARAFPGEEKGLLKFNSKERNRLAKLYPILSHHNNNIFDAFRPNFIRALPAFAVGRTLYQVLGHYFKQKKARLCFTFQSKYLGMSPWKCPGAFAMVPYVEQQFGVEHVAGGLSSLAEAMAKVVEEEGGKIHYDSAVKRVLSEKGAATGVELDDGRMVPADRVILNADFSYAMKELMPEGSLKKYAPNKLLKKKYSCSIFMMYLGVGKRYGLEHHNIVFAKDYEANVSDVFEGRLTDKDFSFYVRDASRVDPTLAPEGKSALYVLVPVPNNLSEIDWQKAAPVLREQTLDLMISRLGLHDIRENIETEKIITPADWERDFNVAHGAVFNLGHQLRQMLWFRPHNRFEEMRNMYLVGGGTHPGSGLPTIYESGRIAANLIENES